MNRIRLLLVAFVCALPIVLGAMQAEIGRRLEITGVNATDLPTLTITANVYDPLGLPIRGLTVNDFVVDADFGFPARIVRVQNVTAEEVPFAAVLVIDVSDSMFGFPLARAREAAAAFVDIVDERDPVALIAFGTRVELVQDFTTDSDLLLAAIDSLTNAGQTALYQAAYEGIDLAANAPEPRRVMILLSDGAEFGGLSRVTPEEVFQHALERGVTVYTIGLGFGADRSFLERLAEVTFGRFYESPTPNELVRIYTELAETLRSQYIITLEVQVPLDGTEYTLELGLSGDDAAAATRFRAPIPIPVVRLPEFPEAEIATPFSLEFDVLADDPLLNVTAVVTDAAGGIVSEAALDPARPQYLIDPEQFPPGRYGLTVIALDADGDRGSAAAEFVVAALPSTITIDPDLTALGALREPVQVQIGSVGQTPIASAEFRVEGPSFPEGAFFPLDLSERLVLLPQILSAGSNRLTVRAVNEAGVTSTAEFPFTVAALPPRVSVVGIVDGQRIETPTQIVANAIGQTQTFAFTARAGQVTLPGTEGTFELDPQVLPPGPLRVSISATDANGQTGTVAVDVEIAALPPIIMVEGLQSGETITEDREIRLVVESQTPVAFVQIAIDDGEVEIQRRPPFGTTLRALELLTGSHVLTITAENEAGQRQTVTLNFTVAESVALTATALAPTPTFTATFTPSPSPTISPTPTPTIDREATGTAQAAIELEITQAAETRSAQLTATAGVATSIFQLTQVAAEIGTAVRLIETAGAQTQAAAQNATQVAAVIQTQVAGLTQTVEAREAELALIAEQTAAAGIAQTATATAVEATQVAGTATAAQVTREAVIAGQTATATAIEATQVAGTATAAQVTREAVIAGQTATATAVE
ncbi:MAG: VWA domain-containing protein, partial [Aggregatilineales bacterium]